MPIERIEPTYYEIETKGVNVYFNTIEDVCDHLLKYCDFVRVTMKTHADKIIHTSQIQDSLNGLKKLATDVNQVRVEGFKEDGYISPLFELNFHSIFITFRCKNESQYRPILDDCMKLVNNYKYSAIQKNTRDVRDLLLGILILAGLYITFLGFKSDFIWVPVGLGVFLVSVVVLTAFCFMRNQMILSWKREQSFWQKNSDGIITSALIAILSVIATGLMTSFIKVYVPQPPAPNNLQPSPANLSPAPSHQK